MLQRLIEKLNDLNEHHQVIFALIAIVSVVFVSWGVETLLEYYVFPGDTLKAACAAILGGLFFLLLSKHVVLHVI